MSRLSLIAGLGLCASSIALSACKDPEVEEFGFACLELVQAVSEEQDPFMNTAKIRVTLTYEECLVEYYTQKHNEQALNGSEGPMVFEEWMERLCTENVNDPLVACEIESISSFDQKLLTTDNPIYQMSITYNITDASKISGRTLLWGPAPVEAFAECQMNQRPFVRLSRKSDVVGLAADGSTLWSALSWKNQRGIIQRSTAGCIQAEISRSGN